MAQPASTTGPNSPAIQQIGTVHGDTNIYYASPDDTPERKYEVALRRLAAGMAGFAEELLVDVLKTGRGNDPDVLYHYLVAALSERSMAELNLPHLQALDTARRLLTTGSAAPTAALRRLGSLVALVDVASRINDRGQLSAQDSELMRRTYQELPLEHQRQLDTLLAGPAKDAAFQDYARQICRRRDADMIDRTRRAGLFFEPDPAEPHEVAVAGREISPVMQAAGFVGALLLAGGLIGLLVQESFIRMIFALVFAGIGAALGPGTSWRRSRDRELLRIKQSRLDGPAKMSTLWSYPLRASLEMVNTEFARMAPGDDGEWRELTKGLRHTLAHEIAENHDTADIVQGRLRWLARWHAEQTWDQVRNDRLLEFQTAYAERPGQKRAVRYGIGLLVVAALLSIPEESVLPWLAAIAGLVVLWRFYLAGLGWRAAHQTAARENAERHRAERAAWEKKSRELRERPSDEEMAAWLADDIDVFKVTVMNERDIRPSDVLCTLEMATGAEYAERARLAYGPVRYSKYVLTIFLLTHSGLRQFQSHLDFLNGDIRGEQRRSVPYGALREVEVQQESIRRSPSGPVPTQYTLPGDDGAAPVSDIQIFHRRFLIRLDSGGTFEIELGGFEDLHAGSEPSDLVARLSLEATGAETALHVLETVVVDGTEWITREQARRRHAGIEHTPAIPRPLSGGDAAAD